MSRTSTLICDFTDELQSVQSKALFNFFFVTESQLELLTLHR